MKRGRWDNFECEHDDDEAVMVMDHGRAIRRCRACERERKRIWRASNREKLREQARIRAPERAPKRRSDYLKRKYGITLEEYEEMCQAQHGVCAICSRPPTPSPGRGGHPALVVDHCHATGAVRALLCNNCNVAIAHAREDADILRAMISYLELSVVTDR